LDHIGIVDITQMQIQIEKKPKGKGTAITGPRLSTYIHLMVSVPITSQDSFHLLLFHHYVYRGVV
jgi:hypothetical protein